MNVERRTMNEPLLNIQHLEVVYRQDGHSVRACDDVSFNLGQGEALGLVGESGSGKTTLGLTVCRLVPHPPAEVRQGQVLFEGRDLLQLDEAALRAVRGGRISYVFQEPATSLNPVFSIGRQLVETITLHTSHQGRDAWAYAEELLRQVGLPSPQARLRSYPHELSGGMKQRVMIAMAIASHPQLLIADEPTTALDVTIQGQILELLQRLREEMKLSLLFITHDLGIVERLADRVAVMYAGRLVEWGDRATVIEHPAHPYTQALLRCVPRTDPWRRAFRPIAGRPPRLTDLPNGCHFHPRCPIAEARCREAVPAWEELTPGHWVRCLKPS